jgi:uncharacterized membrane protein YhaH (DUF805 family)
MEWYLLVWKRFAEFEGRSRRQEYWMFHLFNFLAFIALAGLGGIGIAINQNYGAILFAPFAFYLLAMIIPGLAVAVRRLHDTGRSGWLLLLFGVLGLIPIVGFISAVVQIVFMCQDSIPGTNQYGPSPKYPNQFAPAFAANTPYGGIAPYQSTTGLIPSAPTQQPTHCAACGALLNDASHFCSNCGAHR